MFHDYGVWGGGWLMLLSMFLFWGGLITLAIWGLRGLFATAQSGQPPILARSSLDIVKERYARGEISHEEFIDISQNLKELNQ